MKRLLAVLALGVTLAAVSLRSSSAQQAAIHGADRTAISSTVLPFFRALKRGDVGRIKDYLSEEEYRQYKVLLEENSEYPRFLREHYRGASFHMGNLAMHDDHAVVDVMLSRSIGSSSVIKLHLKKDLGGRWRIGQHDR